MIAPANSIHEFLHGMLQPYKRARGSLTNSVQVNKPRSFCLVARGLVSSLHDRSKPAVCDSSYVPPCGIHGKQLTGMEKLFGERLSLLFSKMSDLGF